MNLKREINLNKKVIIFVLLLNIIGLCSYYSYALFQVNVLKNNVIVIQSASSLDITTTIDNTNTNSFTLSANSSVTKTIYLDTNGITSAMAYKMYYELISGTGTFSVTSTETFTDNKVEGVMQPYERSNNIKITGKILSLTFINNSSNALTITLGAIGGLEAEGVSLTTQSELLVNTNLGVLPEATMSLSTYSGTIDCGGSTTLTVTTNSDGALSCLSSNNTVATCSVTGTTITINGESGQSGSATITVSQADGTNYAGNSQNYNLTINACSSASSWHYMENFGKFSVCSFMGGCSIDCGGDVAWSCTDSDSIPPSAPSLDTGAHCWCKY